MSDMKLFKEYEGISRYAGVPTTQVTGRMHYNENLYGPSPKCFETLKELEKSDIYLYESGPDDDLIDAISKKTGIPVDNLFLNNGSAENIKTIFSVVSKPNMAVVLPDPGWSYYTGIADYKFCDKYYYPILEGETKCYHDFDTLRKLAEDHNPRIIIITSPAMPTSNAGDAEKIEGIIKDFPESVVIMDEAYIGYAPYNLDPIRLINTYDNVVFSRTFSKYYGLANLRIGYGFCSKKLKDVLWLDMPLHRLPHIAKRMAIAALEDDAYYDEVISKIIASREKFRDTLNKIPGVLAYESDTNFVYIKLTGYDAENIKRISQEHGYLIRIFEGNKEKHLRITVVTEDAMDEYTKILVDAIEQSKI